MKRLLVLAAGLTLLAAPLAAQETATNAPIRLPAAEAKAHLGTNAVVTGVVAEVNVAERLVRINLGKPFPNQLFTAVIFSAKTNLFPEVAKLQGKTVEVSGVIAEYRGRPQIILTRTNQLSVVETKEKAEKP